MKKSKQSSSRPPHYIILSDDLKAIIQGTFPNRESAEEYINKKGLSITIWKIEERK